MAFKLGKATVKKIFELDSMFLPLTFGFPQATTGDLQKLKSWYWNSVLSEDPANAQHELFLHSYLVQTGGKNILIDTCSGNHKNRVIPFFNQLDTPFMANLEAAGVTAADIDVVMCTHLHFDHVGWNTRLENGRWVPTFPNARYLFTRADYEYFSKNKEDPVYSLAFDDSVAPIVAHGLAELVETNHVVEHEIDSGIWLQGAPGHSPGSSTVCVQEGKDMIIFSGDTFHHPLQLVAPHMHFSGDSDPVLASKTRAEFFASNADRSTVIFPAHFGGTSGGRIVTREGGFQYAFLESI